MPTANRKTSASQSGFHFINLFQCCPRKFFIRYALKIDTKYIPEALVFGSAFHSGKAVWYKTKSESKAKRDVEAHIKFFKRDFESPQAFALALDRCPVLLGHWIDQWGVTDFKRFKFLSVEKEYRMPLPGTSYFFTARPDAIVEDRQTKEVVVLETKTSASSIQLATDGVYYGDQATAYAWAVRHALGKKPSWIQPDIAYWNKRVTGEKTQCIRSTMVFRTDEDIDQFIKGTTQLTLEIAQKVEAVKKRTHNPHVLFPRNTFYCNAYYRPCEFADVCRLDLSKRLPPGFKKGKGSISILSEVDDVFSVQG